MEERQALMSFAALSQETRLHIVRMLVVAGPDGMAAGAIAEKAEVSPSNVSFHLKELAQADLVTIEQQGRNLIYRADFARMSGLLGYLTEHCCQGGACEANAAPAADPFLPSCC